MTRRNLVLAAVAFACLAAGGLWLLGRDATLQWAVREAQSRSAGKLTLEAVRGSLISRVYADKVAWRGESNIIVADALEVAWSPLWLLAGVVAFDNVRARQLTVTRTATSSEPSRLPDELRLPMRVRFAGAGIGTLTLVAVDGSERSLQQVALSVDAGRDEWAAKLDHLQTSWGSLRGQVKLGTRAPFSLSGTLALDLQDRAAAAPPVVMKATASGTLSAFDVGVEAKAQTSTAVAKIAIEPLLPQPVRSIDAALHAFDVRHVFSDAPEVVLEGTFKAAKDADGTLRGTLAVDNRVAGTIDARRVPIVNVSSEVVAAPERWWLEGLVLDLGAAGRVTGTGWVTAGEAGFVLLTERLDLRGVHAALQPTRAAGTVYTSGPFDRQQWRVSLGDSRIAVSGDGLLEPSRLTVRRAGLRAGGGRFEASGALALDDRHAFTLKTSFAGLDPSQFGHVAKANLSGTLSAQGELAPVVQVKADGTLASSTLFGLPASGRGRWASKGIDDPSIAFDVSAKVGQTRVEARGTVKDPAKPRSLDLGIDLEGNDLQELYTITGLPFPSTPSYRLAGKLALNDSQWSLRGFNGRVGQSDLSGDFAIDLRGERPFMRADLTSQRLDIRDLGGFLGVDYHAPSSAPDKVLPQLPFRLDKLNAANADIRFTGRSIRNERLPLHRMTARLRLDGGRVVLDPLNFRAAGGHIDARVSMDARRAPIRTAADVQVRNLQLSRLAPGVKEVLASAGTIDGRTELQMTGDSLAAMLGSADGEVVLAMNGGSMSDLALRLVDLDVANALVAVARGDRSIPLHCVVADFVAQDGVLRPRTLLLDSEHTVVRGEGALNLGNEELALRLTAEPKDASLFALRGPILVDGTLAHPVIHPELGNLIVRGGAAIALATVATPIAALIPFLQAGKAQQVDCQPLIVDASRFIRAPRNPAPGGNAALPVAASIERGNRVRGQ